MKASRQENHPEETAGEEIRLFPRWTVIVVTVITVLWRLTIVVDPGSWWVLHPDEVYQTAEGE